MRAQDGNVRSAVGMDLQVGFYHVLEEGVTQRVNSEFFRGRCGSETRRSEIFGRFRPYERWVDLAEKSGPRL